MGSGIDRFSSVSRGLLRQRFIPEDQFSQTAGACGLCFAVLSLGLGLVPRDAQSSTGPGLLRRGGAGSQGGSQWSVQNTAIRKQGERDEEGARVWPWYGTLGFSPRLAGCLSTHNFVPDSSDCHLPSQCPSSESRVVWRDVPWSLILSCLFAPLT